MTPDPMPLDLLTPKELFALECMLSTVSLTEAAGRVGVDPGTLHRWLKKPEFVTAYRFLRREALEQLLSGLLALALVVLGLSPSVLSVAFVPWAQSSRRAAPLEPPGYPKPGLHPGSPGIGTARSSRTAGPGGRPSLRETARRLRLRRARPV